MNLFSGIPIKIEYNWIYFKNGPGLNPGASIFAANFLIPGKILFLLLKLLIKEIKEKSW